MTICLSREELEQVTGLRKFSAQISWLRRNGFNVLRRADGMPLVARSHFEQMMGCTIPSKKNSTQEPDFRSMA
jgi:hypothetical protein